MTATESPTLAMSFELIRSRLRDPDFLAGNGLSNEVPFFVFAYDSAQENEVRELTAALVAEHEGDEGPCRITYFDLWDLFCELCENRGILAKLSSLEERRGSEALLERIHRMMGPEEYTAAMDRHCEERHGGLTPGKDVVLIGGVGKVHPFVRTHSILDNLQATFPGIPIVVLYPGIYDGQTLRLFGSVGDGNYYRAFSLI